MKSKTIPVILLIIFISNFSTIIAKAEKLPSSINRQILAKEVLENIAGHELTALTIQLDPGVTVPNHMHSGFVFVYVLKGTIRSKLNNDETIEYKAGESWTEPSGTIHSFTQNPSKTTKAKLLAVFVAKNDSKLTIMGKSTLH